MVGWHAQVVLLTEVSNRNVLAVGTITYDEAHNFKRADCKVRILKGFLLKEHFNWREVVSSLSLRPMPQKNEKSLMTWIKISFQKKDLKVGRRYTRPLRAKTQNTGRGSLITSKTGSIKIAQGVTYKYRIRVMIFPTCGNSVINSSLRRPS